MSRLPETLGLPGLSALVVGLARSGAGAASLLRRHGFAVRAVERKPRSEMEEVAARLERQGADCRFAAEDLSLLDGMDFLVVSPGVPPENVWLAEARRRGVPWLGELELASRFVRGPILAVTGTNGKTTTATWLAHLLRSSGRDVQLAGNVGLALSEVADRLLPSTLAVLEVSSFQLEGVERFHARSAAVLNLTPDHLDRYGSFEEYVRAKARIFERQEPGDLAVLNARDPETLRLGPGIRARLALFDSAGPVELGAGVLDGRLSLFRGGGSTPLPLVESGRVALPGPHNLQNALAALAMTLPWALDPERLCRGLTDFTAPPHRLEPCGEVDGVRFINDSKATNVDSMEKALLSFETPIHLIAGGRDKKGDFEALAPLVRARVKTLLLIGEATERIARAYPGAATVRCATLEDAVREGLERARPGEVVLLSPACASYDMFRDYEERGARFRTAVDHLRAARGGGSRADRAPR